MTMPMNPILLVEDDENDAFFFERALRKAGVPHPLRKVRDGQEAIHYLGATGDFADRQVHPPPVLVVLDLNLPVKNGLEVLRWVRGNTETQNLIVIVLTSSTDVLDLHEAYGLGANSYIVKPADPNRLAALAEALNEYWFGLNSAPPRPDSDPRLRRHVSKPFVP